MSQIFLLSFDNCITAMTSQINQTHIVVDESNLFFITTAEWGRAQLLS